jgi:hypothetical protein
LKRTLHAARRIADRDASTPGPPLLAEAISALPDRELLNALPEEYRRGIEASLADLTEVSGTIG